MLRHILPIIAASCLASCENVCMCDFYESKTLATVETNVDWSDFYQDSPSGMSVYCFNRESGKSQRVLTNDIDKARFIVGPGRYDFLAFNQSEGELGSIWLSGMDCYDRAQLHVSAYKGSSWFDSSVSVIEEPEWIAVGCNDGVEIAATDIIDNSVDCPCEECCCDIQFSNRPINVGDIHPKCIVYSFHISVSVKGIKNLRMARASISGMAASYMLASRSAGSDFAYHLMKDWSIKRMSSSEGHIETTIQCLGLSPCYEEPVLDLQLLLADGKTTVRRSFYVKDKITVDDEHMSMDLSLDLEEALPEVEAPSGGFEATVDDWGDDNDIVLGL